METEYILCLETEGESINASVHVVRLGVIEFV